MDLCGILEFLYSNLLSIYNHPHIEIMKLRKHLSFLNCSTIGELLFTSIRSNLLSFVYNEYLVDDIRSICIYLYKNWFLKLKTTKYA